MSELIRRAKKDEGLRQLCLGVSVSNDSAVKLCKSLGLSIVSMELNVAFVNGDWLDEHQMQHVL